MPKEELEVQEETETSGVEEVAEGSEAEGGEAESAEATTTTTSTQPTVGTQNYEPMYRNVQTALRQEREARRKRDEEFQALQEELQALRGKIPAEQGVDPNEDPAGAILHELGSLKSRLTEREKAEAEAAKTYEEQIAHEQHMQQVAGYTRAQEAEFVKAQPDYYDALNYAVNSRRQYWRVLGVPEHQIEFQIGSEIQSLLDELHGNGVDPARVIYDMAVAWGYRPGAAKTTSPAEASEALDQLDTAAKGQTAISKTKTGKGAKSLTLKEYSDMSIEERKKLTPEQRRAIFEAHGG